MEIHIERLEPDDPRPEFNCTDDDLNDFFHHDSVDAGRELMSVTYVAKGNDEEVVGFFSLSNDSIRKEELGNNRRRNLLRYLPHKKRLHYKVFPTVKVGRLAVAKNMKRMGIGTKILDFLKISFTYQNKTGCRFIVVDAYNKPDALSFYESNGFKYLLADDTKENTRLMHFDLTQVVLEK